jgi:hypothetical protein
VYQSEGLPPDLTRTEAFAFFIARGRFSRNGGGMSSGDIGPAGLKDPLSLFTYLVETGGKVLVTAEEARAPLLRFGYEVETTAKDLRMLGVPAESLDAIWWMRANGGYSIEDLFRILQSLFKSLRPKKGFLVFSYFKSSKDYPWEMRTVMTLLRQTGFQLFHSFESTEEHLLFCQRV